MGTPEDKRLQNYISGDDSTEISAGDESQSGPGDASNSSHPSHPSFSDNPNNPSNPSSQSYPGNQNNSGIPGNPSYPDNQSNTFNEFDSSARKPRSGVNDNQLVPAFTAFFWDYLAVSKELLTHPSSFFSQIDLESGLTKPAMFLAFSAFGTTFLTCVFNGFHILKIPGAFVFEIVACIIVSGAAMTLAKGQGSKASFESIFRVFAYCSCLGWFAGLPVIGMLVGPAGLFYNFMGLKPVLKLNNFQLVTVMGLLCLLQTVLLIARAFQH